MRISVTRALRAPLALLLAALATAPAAHAGPAPRVALIVDDLGEQHEAGERALRLPPAVALSFLPQARHAAEQAERAHAAGHEVMLHMPMEPFDGRQADARALPVGSPAETVRRRLDAALAALPRATGVNNHQGSRYTADAASIDTFMRALAAQPRPYFFVDSRTTAATRAYRSALDHGIAAAERHVFIDAQRGRSAVRAGWQRWLAHARRTGNAVAIVHPYPESLALLEAELPRLRALGFELVPPSALLDEPRRLSVRATSTTGRQAR